MRCSALAAQLDEPMVGSVDYRQRWLLLEDRSAWGSHAVRDLFGADAEARAKVLGIQVVLVRRREGDPADDAVRRAILVDTVTREASMRTVSGPSKLPIDEVAGMDVARFGEPLEGPFFLVCTNGKRDACCALRGRAVVNALAADAPGHVWECTHLGGHRFAGNLVCMPDGIVYGRVTAESAPRLVAAYLERRLDPAHLRGRSGWPPPAQVAERALREQLSLDGLDDLRLTDVALGKGRAIVTLGSPDGAAHRFELETRRASPPRPISCRAEELEEPIHWEIV